MFRSDQKIIGRWARKTPDNMAKTVLFVQSTIQTKFEIIPAKLADIRALGLKSQWMHFKLSRECFQWLNDEFNKLALFQCALEAKDNPHELLSIFSTIPGIGIPKAGFCAQLIFGKAGCIDVWNAKKYGLDKSAFEMRKNAPLTVKNKKIALYLAIASDCGTSEELWDSWCIDMANRYPKIWESGDDVSKYHIKCLEAVGL